MRKQLAIITARGGSKRIPGKNKKEFCGKPILYYSIEAARSAGVFDEIMVSTDDEAIAGLARKAGALVPFYRSAETAGDFASTDDVILEVLTEYRKRGREFDAFCCIYPTAPFLTGERLRRAMELLDTADSRDARHRLFLPSPEGPSHQPTGASDPAVSRIRHGKKPGSSQGVP